MWKEVQPNGKCKYIERYTDPITGKQKKASITLAKDTPSNYKLAYKELQNKIGSLASSDSLKIDLKSLCASYYAYQEKMVKMVTYKRNVGTLNHLKTLLGEHSIVDNLTIGYIEQKLFEHTSDPVTLNGYYMRLKALFKWGFERELHDNYRITKLKPFPEDTSKKERIKDKYLEKSELDKFINGIKEPHWQLVARFLVLSGLRMGEFCALDDKDVDIKNRLIYVNKNYDYRNKVITTTKTFESNREVYMQEELLQVAKEIKHYMKLRKVSIGFRTDIFFSLYGEHLSHFAFNKYLRENSEKIIGRRITPHALRHTHASLLAANGMDIEAIQRRLGHSNSKITKEVYIHTTSELKKRDADAISRISLGI